MGRGDLALPPRSDLAGCTSPIRLRRWPRRIWRGSGPRRGSTGPCPSRGSVPSTTRRRRHLARPRGIRCPSLVIAGQHDFVCGPAWTRLIAAAIPAARYLEIADAGHAPQYEQPGAFRAALLDWLAATRASTGTQVYTNLAQLRSCFPGRRLGSPIRGPSSRVLRNRLATCSLV
jgi:pimeloyl-ACP methyl ester carboxylesterase